MLAQSPSFQSELVPRPSLERESVCLATFPIVDLVTLAGIDSIRDSVYFSPACTNTCVQMPEGNLDLVAT